MRFQSATLFLTTAFSTKTKPSIAFFAIFSISTLSSAFLHGYRNLSCRPTTRISHFVADSSFGLLSPITDIITRSMSSAGGGEGVGGGGGKVALLQFQVSASKSQNQQKVKELIDSTMKENPNTKLIVLPEIWKYVAYF